MDATRRNAILATIIGAIFWSTGGLFIKLLPQDAFTILFYRGFYAAIIFLILFRKSLFRFNTLSFISVLFYVPLVVSFVLATKLTTAANAIFLQYTAPVFVMIFEPYLARTKLKPINLVTVIISMVGLCLFFVDQFSTPESWLGIWIALASGLFLAGLLVTQKLNKSEYIPGTVFWGNILVCLITLPWFVSSPFPSFEENNYLMLLGIGQIGLGYAFFMYGQKQLAAIESSLIAMMEPILNPLWVFIGYGEQPGLWAIAGGLVIIAALIFRLYWVEVREKRIYPT